MDYKFTNEKLDLGEFEKGRKGKYVSIIDEFNKTANRNCIIDCHNETERRSCLGSCKTYVKKHNLNIAIYFKGTKVYLIKI